MNPNLLLAIPLLPLAAAVIAGLFGRQIGRVGAHTVTILGVAASCVLSLGVLKQIYWEGAPTFDAPVYTWLVSDGIHMQVGFLIDRLSALMITLGQLLTLSAILFAISVAGIFLNRKNVILLLMCVELLLLAANFNFVAFSRYLGDIRGQIFVFFVLTVAAAESAIGLAILVVLFRERGSIEVEDINTLKG